VIQVSPAAERRRRRGRWWSIAALLLAAAPMTGAQRTDPLADLRRVWEQPPPDARPMMRWWWFGPAVTPPASDRTNIWPGVCLFVVFSSFEPVTRNIQAFEFA